MISEIERQYLVKMVLINIIIESCFEMEKKDLFHNLDCYSICYRIYRTSYKEGKKYMTLAATKRKAWIL